MAWIIIQFTLQLTDILKSGHLQLDDDDDDNDDDDDANSKDVEVVEISTGETLTILDRLVDLKYLSKEEKNSLVAMKFKLEKMLNKKQSHISDLFYVRIKFVW